MQQGLQTVQPRQQVGHWTLGSDMTCQHVFTAADFSRLRGEVTITDTGAIVTRPAPRRGRPRELHMVGTYNRQQWQGETVGSWRCVRVEIEGGQVITTLRLKRMPA